MSINTSTGAKDTLGGIVTDLLQHMFIHNRVDVNLVSREHIPASCLCRFLLSVDELLEPVLRLASFTFYYINNISK